MKRVSWLPPLGGVLVLLLLAVAWAQWRQSQLVSDAMLAGGDNLAHFLYETENEYRRLREVWPSPVSGPLSQAESAEVIAEVQLRLDIFVSRIGLLRIGAASTLPEIAVAVQAADAFVAKADAALASAAGEASKPSGVAVLIALRPALLDIEPLMRSLTLRAANMVYTSATRLTEAGRAQNRWGLLMTMFLALVAAMFGMLVVRQFRREQARRLELEALAERLREAQREAESASRAKGTFLANMSHEIRTPFQGINGMLELLSGTQLDGRQAGYLRIAQTSSKHLLAILDDVLDMSSMESGRMKIALVPTDADGLLDEVETLMRPQATLRGLSFRLVRGANWPVTARVMLDPTRVRQVLFNLIANAIKFTERGEVVVEADLLCSDGSDVPDTLHFTVRDTGIGMDEATQSRLFERFSQGDDTRKRRFGGTGLGLEISRSLVRLMGGDIVVRSRVGEGSVFTVSLPWTATGRGHLGTPSVPTAEAGTPVQAIGRDVSPVTAGPTVATRSLRVLVADDNEVNRLVLETMLEGLGHTVGLAGDGAEALRAAEATPWDIILMDLHMPVMDGLEAARAILASTPPGRPAVPIVALTADVFDETRASARSAGIVEFLTKPVNASDLRQCLARLTEGRCLPR